MKRIGLLGGMSWQSTATYYRLLNEAIARRLGGLHSAECVLFSVDFEPIERMQREARWDDAAVELVKAAQALERVGVELIVLCTNTMHKLAPQLEAALRVPLVHIADATAARLRTAGLVRVGLLATRYTMEETFYRGRLETRFGLEVLVPDAETRAEINRVIYDELCIGQVLDRSRECFRAAIAQLVSRGAQGIIFGCTEIDMLVSASDAPVPVFDTTAIHVEIAVELALGSGPWSS
jgi:aspartate racemase